MDRTILVSKLDKIKHCANSFTSSGSPSINQSQQLSNAQITSLFQHKTSNPPPQSFNPPPQSFNPSQTLFSGSSPKPTQAVQPPTKSDPFASLTSSHTSRQASPFQFQQSIQPPSVLAAKPPQNPQPSLISTNADEQQDDEWNFASALPVQAPSTITLTNSSLQITWELSRPTSRPILVEIKSKISNNTDVPISNITFQVAVARVSNVICAFW